MSERPNILVIHADQHRFDCLGAYGNPDVCTPNIDALADDGVLYQNSFCPFPVCTPSRYSFLSGLYVHQHLGWSNRSTLPPGIPTFARVLKSAHYRTKAVGKMHFTPAYLDVGFEEMVLAEQDGPGRYDDDYHRWLQREGLCDRIDLMDQVGEYRRNAPRAYWETVGALESDLDEVHHSTTWIADRALETLAGWEGGGNLLMAGFIKPHHPFDPPRPWSEMYAPEALTMLPGWTEACLPQDVVFHSGYFPHETLTEAKLRQAMAFYYAVITQIDHHVGRMIDSLKRKGLYDNTLIVYTSDHGDYMGFHHLLLKGNYMYDPLVKVPLIVKFPHQVRAGERSEALVNNIDLAPTLLQCAGCDVPSSMRGMDLAANVQGRALVFAEGWGGRAYMVRSHKHKLLLCQDGTQSQFFDLERDPLELANSIADRVYQAKIVELTGALSRWALFEAPSQVYRDDCAPVIEGDNVPIRGDGHEARGYDYFRLRMSEPFRAI